MKVHTASFLLGVGISNWTQSKQNSWPSLTLPTNTFPSCDPHLHKERLNLPASQTHKSRVIHAPLSPPHQIHRQFPPTPQQIYPGSPTLCQPPTQATSISFLNHSARLLTGLPASCFGPLKISSLHRSQSDQIRITSLPKILLGHQNPVWNSNPGQLGAMSCASPSSWGLLSPWFTLDEW